MKKTYKYIIVVFQIIVLLVIMEMFIKMGYYVDETNSTPSDIFGSSIFGWIVLFNQFLVVVFCVRSLFKKS